MCDLPRLRLLEVSIGSVMHLSVSRQAHQGMSEVVPEIRTAGMSGFSVPRQHDGAGEEKTTARRPRRNHSPAVKAKVAVAAFKGGKTLVELAQAFDVHPNRIKQWRDQLLAGATGVFGDPPKIEAEPAIDGKTLHAKIGELTPENDLLSGAPGKAVCCPAQVSEPVNATGPSERANRSRREAQRQPAGHRSGGSAGAASTTSRARSRMPI